MLAQAKDRHRHLVKGWVDGGYANAVDASILDWAAQTLGIEGRPYLERARVLGAGDWHQMTRHVLPNVMPLVLANTTLTVAIAIYLETTMSFLGVGPRDTFSWGRILEEAFSAGALTLGLWAWFVPPGLAVVLVVLAFTLVGSAFDEILDPRLRRRGGGGQHGAADVLAAEKERLDADIAAGRRDRSGNTAPPGPP